MSASLASDISMIEGEAAAAAVVDVNDDAVSVGSFSVL